MKYLQRGTEIPWFFLKKKYSKIDKINQDTKAANED